ncbi:hypothetical protein GmHk_17G050178 [Glycine max]|nr:hypothetical protein GmHk_17G050178 [Glycine max]
MWPLSNSEVWKTTSTSLPSCPLKYLMQRVSETMVLTLFILLYFLLTQSSWTQLKVRVQVWTQLKGQENEDRSVSGTVGGASGGTIGGVSGSGTDW